MRHTPHTAALAPTLEAQPRPAALPPLPRLLAWLGSHLRCLTALLMCSPQAAPGRALPKHPAHVAKLSYTKQIVKLLITACSKVDEHSGQQSHTFGEGHTTGIKAMAWVLCCFKVVRCNHSQPLKASSGVTKVR